MQARPQPRWIAAMKVWSPGWRLTQSRHGSDYRNVRVRWFASAWSLWDSGPRDLTTITARDLYESDSTSWESARLMPGQW